MFDTYAGCEDIVDFRPEDGHRFVEIFTNTTTDSPRFSTGTLKHAEIQSWLGGDIDDGKLTTGPRFRLFVTKPIQLSARGSKKCPLSSETFHFILRKFHIPPAFANYAASYTTLATDFSTVEPYPDIDRFRGIIYILGGIRLGLCFDAKTKITSAIVGGICEHQVEWLIDLARASAALLLRTPMLFPVFMLEAMSRTRAYRVIGRKDAVFRAELSLGIHWSFDKDMIPLSELDFDQLTRQLTMIGSTACWDLQAIDAQEDMAALTERVYDSMCEDSVSGGEVRDCRVLRERIRNVKQVLASLRRSTAYNQQRVQVQLQTVYSLVSQRDNEISYATAVSSQRIAGAAQQDGTIMKQLAADSRAIALAARRDGVAMRIMAAVTLMTLPGTFTATLFSTTFFDFQPRDRTSLVSPWIWLYVVVTAGFTLFFVAAWYFSTKTMTKKIVDAVPSTENKDSEITGTGYVNIPGVKLTSRNLEEVHTSTPSPPSCDVNQPVRLLKQSKQLSIPGFNSARKPAPSASTGAERAYWDASSTLGTQSYNPSGKACAVCGSGVD